MTGPATPPPSRLRGYKWEDMDDCPLLLPTNHMDIEGLLKRLRQLEGEQKVSDVKMINMILAQYPQLEHEHSGWRETLVPFLEESARDCRLKLVEDGYRLCRCFRY